MTLIRCRSPQIPCYHYISTSNSDTYSCCSNKIVVIVGLCNQGLRICNTQTTHLSINIMTNYRTFSFIVSGVVAFISIASHFGVQALDKATAEQCKTHAWPQAAHQVHMDWCADNGYATNWVPGVMPGGRTSHSVLPPTEGGYLNQMTALHIRKNVREFFPWAASLPGTAVKVCKQLQPDEQTIKNAIYSSRVSIATFFTHIK